jgi:hypothetical protein
MSNEHEYKVSCSWGCLAAILVIVLLFSVCSLQGRVERLERLDCSSIDRQWPPGPDRSPL